MLTSNYKRVRLKRMYFRVQLLLLLVLIAAPGCVSRQQLRTTIDAMRIEYLALENSYGELEYEYSRKVQELEIAKSELEANKSGSPTPTPRRGGSDPDIELPHFGGPDSRDDDKDDGSPKIEVPDIELPELDSNSLNRGGGPRESSVHSASSAREGPDRLQFAPPRSKRPFDMRVTHIIIAPYVSTGRDFDGQPGDDGIALVIEPRNGDDLFVPVAGELTVSVLDAAEEGENRRVALWQFDKGEAQRRMRDLPGLGRGINLKLPWPQKAPAHSNLTAFVRYRTEDGRLLETSADIRVAANGESAVAWTGRQPRVGNGLIEGQSTGQPSRFAGGGHRPDVGPLADESNRLQDQAQPGGLGGAGSQVARPVWKPFR